MQSARLWIGTPYHLTASKIGAGCDCLGLLRGVWRDLYGSEPEPYQPVGSEDWYINAPDALVAAADRWLIRVEGPELGAVAVMAMGRAQAGNHCGILSRDGGIVHAFNSPGAGRDAVVEVPFSGALTRRVFGYWRFPGVLV